MIRSSGPWREGRCDSKKSGHTASLGLPPLAVAVNGTYLGDEFMAVPQ